MAIRMRVWLALILGACTGVAATLLPPDRLELPPREESPEQLRRDEVLGELRRAHTTLQLTRWSDSLSALVLGDADGRTTGREMRFGLFWQPRTHGALRDVPLGIPTSSSITFADVVGDPPYCFTVHTVAGSMDELDRPPLEALPDPCRMLERFGAPGPRIAEWLEGGAWGFGSRSEPAPDYMTLRDRSFAEVRYFGERRHPLARANVFAAGCLAGRAAACARAVVEPIEVASIGSDLRDAAEGSGASYAAVDWSDDSPFSYLDDTLFAELEQQFGAGAFARFWSSDEEVPVAFEAAFGVELGEWVQAWVDGQMGTSYAGPGIPSGDLLLGVLTVGALSAMAGGVAMRRRVA